VSTTELSASLRDALTEAWEAHAPRPFDPKRPSVRLHEATFGPDEIWEALECLLTTQVTMGRKVLRFEADFRRQFNFRHATMSNSGSSANLLAVAALTNPACSKRLQPGDEVIVPALSWSTTVWPLVQHGLVPVVVDIDRATLNIDPNEIERAIGPKTRGLMIVHVYGNPCDMAAVTRIAKDRSLVLIEDCCEALGASYGGKSVGRFGRVGTYSFYYSHHITTLEGGMSATDDLELAELMRILRAHGWVRESERREEYARSHPDIHPRFLFVNQGYNLRPTELQGAIGSVQLPKLRKFIKIRASNAAYWRRRFTPYLDEFDLQEETRGGESSWFGFPLTVREKAPFEAKELTRALEKKGVETRPLICGNIAAQPAMKLYKHRVQGDLKNAVRAMKSGFTFGNHQGVDARAREYVARCVTEFLAKKGIRAR
jgi:CDP-6-deoxy-D-xylo-4-hexulose-3-dehydrase